MLHIGNWTVFVADFRLIDRVYAYAAMQNARADMAGSEHARIGIVVIGRNEGERLRRCLRSLPAAAQRIYVDSESADGSATWARSQGVAVVELTAPPKHTA